MKRITLFLTCMLTTVCMLIAQQDVELQINNAQNSWEDFKLHGVCPGVQHSYKIVGYDASCHSLSGGVPFSIAANGEFSTSWSDDVGYLNHSFTITKSNNANCASARTGATFNIKVLSIKGLDPVVTRIPAGNPLYSGPLHVGTAWDASFRAEMKWDSTCLGTLDSAHKAPFLFKEFMWTIPSAWTKLTDGEDTINTATDLATGGMIIAVAKNPVCSNTTDSDQGKFNVTRSMPSPCLNTIPQIIGDVRNYELCGDPIMNSFSCAPLPANFTPPSAGVTRVWTLTPDDGWLKLGQAGSTIEYLTDGKKARNLKVTVSAYGVSSSCDVDIPLFLVNPNTKVIGIDTLCSTGTFKLSIQPSDSVYTTWSVKSLTPGFTAPVLPTSGTGTVAALAPSSSGLAEISFTLQGCGITKVFRDTFFAGKPIIKPLKIDGKPLHSGLNFVCPDDLEGSHYITLSPIGDDDARIDTFEITGAATSWQGGTNELDFTLKYNGGTSKPPYDCVVIQAYASNACGVTKEVFYVCPSYWACYDNPWFFKLSPNPTDQQTNITLNLKDSNGTSSVVKMDKFEVIDKTGNIITEIKPESEEHWLNTSNYPNGTYYLKTIIEGSPLMEAFIVEHGK